MNKQFISRDVLWSRLTFWPYAAILTLLLAEMDEPGGHWFGTLLLGGLFLVVFLYHASRQGYIHYVLFPDKVRLRRLIGKPVVLEIEDCSHFQEIPIVGTSRVEFVFVFEQAVIEISVVLTSRKAYEKVLILRKMGQSANRLE